MDAERPERVLVAADDAEVLAVAVHAQTSPSSPLSISSFSLRTPGWYSSRWPGMSTRSRSPREREQLLHLGGAHRRRLLDEDVLARLERPPRELVVRRDRRRDRRRRRARRRPAARRSRRSCGRSGSGRANSRAAAPSSVAEPRELGELVEVAGEVRAPVAEAGLADPASKLPDLLARAARSRRSRCGGRRRRRRSTSCGVVDRRSAR